MSRPLLLVAEGVVPLDGSPNPIPPRAVLINGARIAQVGSDPATLAALAAGAGSGGTQTADLGRAWIAPAFVDAHVHATATGLSEQGIDLSDAGSAAQCVERVRRRAAEDDSPILLGRGWDSFAWTEPGLPTAEQLSSASGGRTVLLVRVDAHSCLVDAATLARLPLERLDGVDRDARGAPTGWLRDEACEAAMTMVRCELPRFALTAAREAVCRRAAERGIASLHEMGHPSLSGIDDALAWASGEWPIEVLVWWADLERFSADASALVSEGLRPGGDLFLDGSIGSRTAAVTAAYSDGGHGRLFFDDDSVARFFAQCTAAGRGAGVHAIGERAIEQATVALERAAQRFGAPAVQACRHRIEHAELASREQIRRLAQLGAAASVQPAFDAVWGGSEGLYAKEFGEERALRSNPVAWFAEEGLLMAFGSDSTVTPMDPWAGIAAAERHRGGLGIARDEALRAHTIGGHRVAGQDDVGPLAAGMRADLAIWDGDPLGADPEALRCLATVAAGRVVHGDLGIREDPA